jgi:hypothetical protein
LKEIKELHLVQYAEIVLKGILGGWLSELGRRVGRLVGLEKKMRIVISQQIII